jgi:hypothetical protein
MKRKEKEEGKSSSLSYARRNKKEREREMRKVQFTFHHRAVTAYKTYASNMNEMNKIFIPHETFAPTHKFCLNV